MHKEYLLAGSSEASIDQLKLLAKHPNSRVRRRVAENLISNIQILEQLQNDNDPEVRIAVARNKNTNFQMLEGLSNDESVAVRFGLASAHDMPVDIIEKLAQDDHPYVSSRAQRTLEGIHLENALKEISFKHHENEEAKLGDVLVKANILSQEQIDEYLQTAKANNQPLGRTLVQMRALPRNVIVLALQAQLHVRKKSKKIDDAIRDLKKIIENSQILNTSNPFTGLKK